jgi:hypothetical protein
LDHELGITRGTDREEFQSDKKKYEWPGKF